MSAGRAWLHAFFQFVFVKHEAAARPRSAQAQGRGGVMLVLLAEKGQRLLMTDMSEKSIFALCELVFCNVCAPHSEPEEEKSLFFSARVCRDGFMPEVTCDGCKGPFSGVKDELRARVQYLLSASLPPVLPSVHRFKLSSRQSTQQTVSCDVNTQSFC